MNQQISQNFKNFIKYHTGSDILESHVVDIDSGDDREIHLVQFELGPSGFNGKQWVVPIGLNEKWCSKW